MDEEKVGLQDIVETKDSDTEEVAGAHHATSPEENDPGEEDKTHNVQAEGGEKRESMKFVSPNASPKVPRNLNLDPSRHRGVGRKNPGDVQP